MNFHTLFSHKQESHDVPPDTSLWRELTQPSHLDEITKLSFQQTVVVFKHSSLCRISSSVLSRLESKIIEQSIDFPLYFLDLIKYRDLSDVISYKFRVTHQSPQLLMISNGKSIMNSSHYNILDNDLEDFLK